MQFNGKINLSGLMDLLSKWKRSFVAFLERVKYIGATPAMTSQERSKLGIFNYLNFFQFVTGVIIPIIGFYHADIFMRAWFMASLPAFISVAVLILNAKGRHETALLVYFVFYPVFICLTYINGISLGAELSFILYGILSVFFIKDIGYMVFSISFSMISYFILSVVWRSYPYQLEKINIAAYLINQGLAIIYIFYGLYLIKTENANYNTALHKTNDEMQRQAVLLQRQAEELEQLNSLKNKLFTVISHDLKAPMYALRNLFNNIQTQKMPAGEIKALIPDVNRDLNYTVSLMENLLQWAKSQMNANTVSWQAINASELAAEVTQVLRLQAEAKNITVENHAGEEVVLLADYDMVSLVLRNLMANAIKFTPPGGLIEIGANEIDNFVEVYVRDFGKGITAAELAKINREEFYTTNGTAHEQGTGLGLILCREFLAKNGGQLRIESEPGQGSTFSFTLPKVE